MRKCTLCGKPVRRLKVFDDFWAWVHASPAGHVAEVKNA